MQFSVKPEHMARIAKIFSDDEDDEEDLSMKEEVVVKN
jgi:hypothetical protein